MIMQIFVVENKYDSLNLMIIKIDRLVDIMNNICQMIDCLDHFYIQELLDIIYFCKWKDKAKHNDEHFITW